MLKIKLPSSQKYIPGALVAAVAIYALANSEFVIGIPGLLLALVIVTTYRYIDFDFAAGYQRKLTCLFGIIRLGSRQQLPVIDHLVLKRFSELIEQEISDSGVYQTIRNQRYIILFSIPDSNKGVIILEVPDLKEARKIAQDIARAGNLALKDYTS